MNRFVLPLAVAGLLMGSYAQAEVRPVDYTYKQVGDLAIKAAVYREGGDDKRVDRRVG